MVLKVIYKYKPHQKPVIRYTLSDDMKMMFAKYFVMKQKLTKNEMDDILSTCKKIYENHYWVQCDCVAQSNKPLFIFKRSPKGKLFLSRLTDRAQHLDYCVFKENDTKHSNKTNLDKVYRPVLEQKGALNLLNQRADGISAGLPANSLNTGSSKSYATRPTHKLARALYLILEQGGFNHFNPANKLTLDKAYDQATKGIELAANHHLSNYFGKNIKKLVDIANSLRNTNDWPKNMPKQGLILTKVKSFNGNTLQVIHPHHPKDKNPEIIPVEIHNRIYQWSGRYSERTAPYMALILVTDLTTKPGFFIPFSAFLMPCYSEKSNMPVDSYYERIVLKSLYKLAFEYAKTNQPVEIIKPVKDYSVTDNSGQLQYVLPDFIMKRGDITLIVEVNGSHEPEYLERKKRTHGYMKQLGKVLAFDAYGQEKRNYLEQGISKLISQIRRELQC